MIEYNPRRQKTNAAGGAIITPAKIDVICINNERDRALQSTGRTF